MTSSARKTFAPLSDEAGVAVPIALAVLLAAVLLATAATGLAIQAIQTSRRDSSSKASIEAANAGLRTAIYRLNTYQPDGDHCPTEPTNYPVGANGAPTSTLCAPDGPDVSQGLGNGANFTYWISEAMQTGDTCTGPTVSNSLSGVAQRCITAVGTANGVSARVQERVAAYTSAPAFPAAIFGTKAVTISNNVTIGSDTPGSPGLLGTNGTLTVGGGRTVIDGYQLPPGATCVGCTGVTNLGPTTGLSAPYPTPTPIYPFSTHTNTDGPPYDNASRIQAGTCSQQEAQAPPLNWSGTWVQTNCDYEISQGITHPGCLSGVTPVADCDVSTKLSSGTTGFDPVGRTLYLPNNSTLVLQGGYYNFCSLYLSNNSQISVANAGKVTIFIDSPSDGPSGCSTTDSAQGVAPGTFTMRQNSTLNSTGTALNTQVLVYGDETNVPPTSGAVTLDNNGSSAFALLAPFSIVSDLPSSNTTFRGAIVGYTVTLGNASNFTYEADTSSFQSTSVPIYYPSYWEQCPAQSSSSTDPTAGC